MPNITTRTIRSARPKSAPFFIRDTKLQGFAVKVNPSGSVKYVAEVWNQGKSHRKTIGSFPEMTVSDARREAIAFIDS